MGILSILLRAVTWWNSATINTALYTARHGVKVGTDEQGNTFYRSKDGKRRWVIYNGEAEASRISPEWHGWLHHTWDAPPTEAPVRRKPWEKPHQENLTGTPAAWVPPGSIRRPEPVTRRDYEAWSPE
jgi:NADH:ubiquinone oxidoreductase subunit